MHAACKAFIESEACEKLIRAIKAKTTVSNGIIYQPGDIVYYKRENSNMWKGPDTVIGREQIIVKHRGTQIRVHVCRLQHAKDLEIDHPNKKLESDDTIDNNKEIFKIYDDSDLNMINNIETNILSDS